MSERALHCVHCGRRFAADAGWPRRCDGCGETSYRNPLPVAVAVLPLRLGGGRTGLVGVRRAIEPGRGKIALPGGYIDGGEDWRRAVLRELREETGIALDATAADVQVFAVLSNPAGDRLTIFGRLPAQDAAALPPFAGDGESSERVIIEGPQELAFSSHTEVVARFFAA